MQNAGTLLPAEVNLNFLNATIADNPANKSTDVTINATVSPGTAAQLYQTNSVPAGSWVTFSGDATVAVGGAVTVVKVNGASVPTAGSLVTGNVLQVTGASALGYGAVNLAGGAGYVTGALPLANLQLGTAAQIPVMNAGVTAPVWVTMSGGATMDSTGVVTVVTSATSLGGEVTGTLAASVLTGPLTNPLKLQGGTLATTGDIRAANNTVILAARNAANSGNYNLISTDSSDQMVIGDPTGGNALAALLVQFAGTTALGINSGGVSTNSPVALSGGSYESHTGILRIFNTGAINWRNAANSDDVLGLAVNTSNQITFGGGEVILDCNSTTAPFLQSYATATSLTVGTDKSAATLVLQAGAAATALTLSNPSGTLVASTTAGQVVGFWQNHGTNYTIDSAGAGDDQVWMTAACTITLPDPAANAGRRLEIVVNYDPAAGGGTIKRHGSENINGAASDITLVTGDKYSIIQVRCDGGNWIVKGGLSI